MQIHLNKVNITAACKQDFRIRRDGSTGKVHGRSRHQAHTCRPSASTGHYRTSERSSATPLCRPNTRTSGIDAPVTRRSYLAPWSCKYGSTSARGGAPTTRAAAAGPSAGSGTVVVTREAGKNSKLVQALGEQSSVDCIELPLIEHADGEDRSQLAPTLKEHWDWIMVTSPEAAKVLLESWRTAGSPPLRVASVGTGTAKVLKDGGLESTFTPSKANAVTLAAELPMERLGATSDGPVRALYPASAKASQELQNGLAARGLEVVRLNTYTTLPATAVNASLIQAVSSASPPLVVTFASPSAVKAWVSILQQLGPENAGPLQNGTAFACIGSTSATACKKLGLGPIFSPENPGIEGWVTSILEALESNAASTTVTKC